MNKFEPLKKKIYKEKVVISMRIEEDTLTKIDDLSRATDISRNEFINQCINYALANMEPTKKAKMQTKIKTGAL